MTDPEILTARFDEYVLGIFKLLRLKIVRPGRAAAGLEFRCELYDDLMRRAAAERN